MSERTLIPLDGSKTGEAAVSYIEKLATKLAPVHKVEVILFHVITLEVHHKEVDYLGAVDVPYTKDELQEMKKKSMDYLEKVSEGLRKIGATVKYEVAIGKPADEIIKAEATFKADLVAMSTHGRSGLSRWAYGSIADRVLRGGTVPVLMVRAGEQIE
jgi:nucleotide-binding universal stress UspA family protein